MEVVENVVMVARAVEAVGMATAFTGQSVEDSAGGVTGIGVGMVCLSLDSCKGQNRWVTQTLRPIPTSPNHHECERKKTGPSDDCHTKQLQHKEPRQACDNGIL